MEKIYLSADSLNVGYSKKTLIKNINFDVKKGEILSLIGPNGSGKSTILKSITKQLETIAGTVYIENKEFNKISSKDLAKKMAVVLTEKIAPEIMTCREVVSIGRYPYTGYFGKLSEEDLKIVDEAIKMVNAEEIADKDFNNISDGQKQRIMLARAICQQPEIIILDEPTSYLDIKFKIELLEILKKMSRENKITIIMSLHEVDLASKISDKIMFVKGDQISQFGAPEDICTTTNINNLYNLNDGTFNINFGSVELAGTKNNPRVFVLAGNGKGIPVFRCLQKQDIAFYTGLLYENDIDYQLASDLSSSVFSIPAFEDAQDEDIKKCKEVLLNCDKLINPSIEIKKHNMFQKELLDFATSNNIEIENWNFKKDMD